MTPGEYLSWAQRHGYETSFTRCWKHEDIPETIDADMLVVLGGYQCPATTREECDYFDAASEKALIKYCVDQSRMVIGVCLGAQLVGEALGASYSHSPEREIGPVEAYLTEHGKNHPFFAEFPETFLAGEWHNDMPGLTEDSLILAWSEGCPRQIIQYGKYVYGFQTHMEFTQEIITAGIKEAGDSLNRGGRFVQTREQLRSFDYTEMNRLLASFLDSMVDDYILSRTPPDAMGCGQHICLSGAQQAGANHGNCPDIAQIMEKMIAFSQGNLHDIDHLIRVWTYAKTIGELEHLDQDTLYILEVAAITHDIACPLCREKYGSTSGKYQEKEGALMVREFLQGTGLNEDQISRVSFLVGHHHTFSHIDGPDYQILVEADYIANASENGYSAKNVENFMERVMKTQSGRKLAGEVFCS